MKVTTLGKIANGSTFVSVGRNSAPQIDALNVAKKYATDVIKGNVVAGKLVKLAAKRFVQDVKYGSERGLYLDAKAAQRVVDFFGHLHHWKGEWGNQPFVLQPWQTFILVNIFGFKWQGNPGHEDGTRRYREIHVEVGRKNGKSTFLAGIGLYCLLYDEEPGAEVYSAATKKEQAKITFDTAVEMRKRSPALKAKISAFRNNLSVMATGSKFEPLSSEDQTLDGLNSHCLLIDELHAHKDRKLYDVLNESTASRRNPLTLAITTAGYDTLGVCYAQRRIGIRILTGSIDARGGDAFFAYIASIDDEDDWHDEKCWPKANPNLGISVKLDKLRDAARKAEAEPTELNSFLRKHLNVWTSQDVRWMPDGKWAKCNAAGSLADPAKLRAAAMEKLKGRQCLLGLDLSSKIDLSAVVLLFPPVEAKYRKEPIPQTMQERQFGKPPEIKLIEISPADPKWSVLPFFWLPKENIKERVDRDRVAYDVWVREGFILPQPGNSIDHEVIFRFILKELKPRFHIEGVGFDDWNAQWISKRLEEEGFKIDKVGMGFRSMSEPMKELMAFTLERKIEHFGNPVLGWNIDNVQATTDPAGNIKPDKEMSREKIDGAVATIMCIALVKMKPELAETSGSVYSKRGIIFL